MSGEKPMGQVIQIDEARIRDHLGEMVRGTVEETLNAMLDAEADQLCGAGRYERSQARQDTRALVLESALASVSVPNGGARSRCDPRGGRPRGRPGARRPRQAEGPARRVSPRRGRRLR